jgi:hypothetical protein
MFYESRRAQISWPEVPPAPVLAFQRLTLVSWWSRLAPPDGLGFTTAASTGSVGPWRLPS